LIDVNLASCFPCASDRHDSRYDPPEKIPRPYVQGTLVHNEGGDFPARLFHIEVIHGLPQEVLESVGSQLVGIDEIEKNDWSLTPGRYVGMTPEDEHQGNIYFAQ
jgi:hypothetical protein